MGVLWDGGGYSTLSRGASAYCIGQREISCLTMLAYFSATPTILCAKRGSKRGKSEGGRSIVMVVCDATRWKTTNESIPLVNLQFLLGIASSAFGTVKDAFTEVTGGNSVEQGYRHPPAGRGQNGVVVATQFTPQTGTVPAPR
jgi:hypothetical protein